VLVSLLVGAAPEIVRPWPAKLLDDDVLGVTPSPTVAGIRAWLPGARGVVIRGRAYREAAAAMAEVRDAVETVARELGSILLQSGGRSTEMASEG